MPEWLVMVLLAVFGFVQIGVILIGLMAIGGWLFTKKGEFSWSETWGFAHFVTISGYAFVIDLDNINANASLFLTVVTLCISGFLAWAYCWSNSTQS